MNQYDLMNYIQMAHRFTWRLSDHIYGANQYNEGAMNIIAHAVGHLDPFGSKVQRVRLTQYGGIHHFYRVGLTIEHDDDHFWFRAVYQVIGPIAYGSEEWSSIPELVNAFEDLINETANDYTLGHHGTLPQLHGRREGFVYVVLEGGAPIDNAAIGVTEEADYSGLATGLNRRMLTGYNLNHYRVPTKALTLYVEKDTVLEENLSFGGRICVEPHGTFGLLQGRVITIDNKGTRNCNVPSFSFQNNDLLESIRQLDCIKRQPYDGWIPKDLSNVKVQTQEFAMVKVGDDGKALFGSDLAGRLLKRRFHFRGAVSLLYRGKKYPVESGVYFMTLSSTSLSSINMLDYDDLVSNILPEITMLSNSSRSQAITSRVDDDTGAVIKTSIKKRNLSAKDNGDSGFIPRPVKRRIQ
jgi:hypothetical protein